MMSRNKIIYVVLAVVAVALVGATVFVKLEVQKGSNPSAGGSPTTVGTVDNNLKVPEASSTDLPKNVAKPELVAPAGPSTDASQRNFPPIIAEGNKFVPDTIIVREKDIIRIKITAIDKNYDFTQPEFGFDGNAKIIIPKGETKTIEFQTGGVGKFKFYCSTCGGPEKGPVGYINVVSK